MVKTIKTLFFFSVFLYTNSSFSRPSYIQSIYRESFQMARERPWQLINCTSLMATLSFLGYVAQKRYKEDKPITSVREALTTIGVVIPLHFYLQEIIFTFHLYSSKSLSDKIYKSCESVYMHSLGEYPSDQLALGFDVFMLTIGANILIELNDLCSDKKKISKEITDKENTSNVT